MIHGRTLLQMNSYEIEYLRVLIRGKTVSVYSPKVPRQVPAVGLWGLFSIGLRRIYLS